MWTLENNSVLRNSVPFNYGWASELLWWNGEVYHKGAGTKEWYTWDGTTWISNGLADPQTGVSTTPTVQPTITGTSGLRTVITTGSIPVNSNQLTLPSSAGFNVGDWVIVEIGKEPGQGMRGTRGVGGTWPAKSYATEAQVYADKSLPNKTYVWAEDTGFVFWWLDGQWYNVAPNRTNTFYTGSYYMGKAIPRSLQAKVTAVNGNTLTLDKNAAVSVSGANVYLDTAPIITDLINKNANLTLPSGNFPTGGVVWIQNKTGFTLSGAGKDATKIYSPKGLPSAAFKGPGLPN